MILVKAYLVANLKALIKASPTSHESVYSEQMQTAFIRLSMYQIRQ